MTPPDQADTEVRRLDRLCDAYLTALDGDDWATLADLWRRAEVDPALEQALHEVDEYLLVEEGVTPEWDAARRDVLGLVGQHLPSAADAAAPPTVGDVAVRLAADAARFARLPEADRAANAALLADRTPLPPTMTGPSMAGLRAALPVTAGDVYWRAFQDAAIRLNMARTQLARAAARPAGAPRRRGKP